MNSLEQQLERELKLPGDIVPLCACDLTEGAVTKAAIRIGKGRRICKIEAFHAELEIRTLMDMKCLEHGEIDRFEVRPIQEIPL